MYILTSKYFPLDYWPDDYFPVLPDAVVDIQYKEVVEFTLTAAVTAEFELVLPNDVETVVGTMVVSGAGTTAANGTYTYAGETFGKPLYMDGDNSILWYDSKWAIINAFESGNRYESTDDVATPDLVTTWTVGGDGIAPVPTVTSTNPLSGISVTVPFTVEMPTVIEIETYEELSL